MKLEMRPYTAFKTTEAMADLGIASFDVLSGPAYQESMSHNGSLSVGEGLGLGMAITHGIGGIATACFAGGEDEPKLWANAGAEGIKTAGFILQATGNPVIGALVVGIGVTGDALTGLTSNE